ncbi:hypothetical protein AADZ86_10135 [Colwelliaceae bacterium BS250]
MKKSILTIVTALALFSVSSLSYSEEAGKRYDASASWKSVVKINFKPGKTNDALKIIKDYYKPATVKAKTSGPETIMEMHTGDYDLLVVWGMPGGISDMTWENHPDNKLWRDALNEIAGGEEKAQAIMDEYLSYIDNAESDIAMVR